MTSQRFSITKDGQAAAPRRAAVDRARELGFGEAGAGRVALVATELATNIAQHAGDGQILIRDTGGSTPGIEVLALDKGPGISSVPRAMQDGYSTAGTLGHGLGSVGRQADEFEVFTQTPGGTVVVARIWPATPRRDETFAVAGVSVARAGEPVCGDDWSVTWRQRQGELLVVDGLGHGVGASEAATLAVRIFNSSRAGSAPMLVEELHHALRPTRGAAVGVAAIDLESEVLKFAGLGNVGASIVTPERKRTSLVSQNGTAGHAARRISEFSYPFRTGSILVMFSDGLTSSWDPGVYPGLWSYDPAIIAGVLYRDFSRGRDDVTVVVGKRRDDPSARS
jgi:anti-sigma regulatory factor (Ser/Thr protein kinase)